MSYVVLPAGPRAFTMKTGSRRAALDSLLDLSHVVLMTEVGATHQQAALLEACGSCVHVGVGCCCDACDCEMMASAGAVPHTAQNGTAHMYLFINTPHQLVQGQAVQLIFA